MNRRGLLAYLAGHGPGRALRHRQYALFLFLGWFSNVGFWMQRVAVQWLVWDLTGSGAWLGAVALAEAGALIAVVPVAGVVSDRFDRLAVAKLTQVAAMVVAGTIAVLTLSGLIRVEILAVLMALAGATEGFFIPARLAIVPNLVPPEDFPAAVGISATLFNMAQLVGPAAAGVVIALWGVGWAFAYNSASFLCYLWALSQIRLLRHDPRAGKSEGILSAMFAGVTYAVRHKGIGPMFLLLMVAGFSLRAFLDLLAGIADAEFGRGTEGLAILASSFGLGAMLGGLVVASVRRPVALMALVYGFILSSTLFLLIFSSTSHFWLAALACVFMGCGLVAYNIGGQVLIQTALVGEMRGRVMSLWSLVNRGAPGLGALTVGALSTEWGFRVPLMGAAALIGIVWLVYLPRRRSLLSALAPPGDEKG